MRENNTFNTGFELMPFDFERLEIPDLILLKPKCFEDSRGYFMETYKKSEFESAGINQDFVQDNHSFSRRSVLRGLHYQLNPDAQGKLVRCTRGEIFDVAVDIRKGSPHFGEWVGVRLSEGNMKMLFVPEGFAHGFLVTGSSAHVLYKTTREYSPEREAGVIWNDPEIDVDWPLEREPIISDKDSELPTLKEAENNFTYEQ